MTNNTLITLTDRCETCRFATRITEPSKSSLCCWRFPPTIHRKWFRFVELYPAVEDRAICGEYKPKASQSEETTDA